MASSSTTSEASIRPRRHSLLVSQVKNSEPDGSQPRRHSDSAKPTQPEVERRPNRRFSATRTGLMLCRAKPVAHECLREHSFFKDRDPKLLQLMLENVSLKIFLPGMDIIKEGEDGTTMYFLYRGEVDVLIGPDEKKVAELKDGSLFGEMALLGLGKRKATIRATSICDCRVIHSEAFQVCLKRFPAEKTYFDQLAKERLAEIAQSTKKDDGSSSKEGSRTSTMEELCKPLQDQKALTSPTSPCSPRSPRRKSLMNLRLTLTKGHGSSTSPAHSAEGSTKDSHDVHDTNEQGRGSSKHSTLKLAKENIPSSSQAESSSEVPTSQPNEVHDATDQRSDLGSPSSSSSEDSSRPNSQEGQKIDLTYPPSSPNNSKLTKGNGSSTFPAPPAEGSTKESNDIHDATGQRSGLVSPSLSSSGGFSRQSSKEDLQVDLTDPPSSPNILKLTSSSKASLAEGSSVPSNRESHEVNHSNEKKVCSAPPGPGLSGQSSQQDLEVDPVSPSSLLAPCPLTSYPQSSSPSGPRSSENESSQQDLRVDAASPSSFSAAVSPRCTSQSSSLSDPRSSKIQCSQPIKDRPVKEHVPSTPQVAAPQAISAEPTEGAVCSTVDDTVASASPCQLSARGSSQPKEEERPEMRGSPPIDDLKNSQYLAIDDPLRDLGTSCSQTTAFSDGTLFRTSTSQTTTWSDGPFLSENHCVVDSRTSTSDDLLMLQELGPNRASPSSSSGPCALSWKPQSSSSKLTEQNMSSRAQAAPAEGSCALPQKKLDDVHDGIEQKVSLASPCSLSSGSSVRQCSNPVKEPELASLCPSPAPRPLKQQLEPIKVGPSSASLQSACSSARGEPQPIDPKADLLPPISCKNEPLQKAERSPQPPTSSKPVVPPAGDRTNGFKVASHWRYVSACTTDKFFKEVSNGWCEATGRSDGSKEAGNARHASDISGLLEPSSHLKPVITFSLLYRESHQSNSRGRVGRGGVKHRAACGFAG